MYIMPGYGALHQFFATFKEPKRDGDAGKQPIINSW